MQHPFCLLSPKVKNAPTEYFEAKPQRAVGLNEFVGAIVPNSAPQKALDILEKNGIAIKKYNPFKAGDREQKLELSARQQQVKFSRKSSINKATPKRQASTLAQAREMAQEFVGKPLINNSTGLRAVVSGNNLRKMTNESATHKSSSPQDHALAVANADHLFVNAILNESHSDKRGEPTIASIHRYVAPMINQDGDVLAVKLTVKETTGANEPNPLYTVESLEIGKPEREAPKNGIERVIGQDRQTPQSGFNKNVQQSIDEVKQALDETQFSRKTAEQAYLARVNEDFNHELQQFKAGKLPDSHVFKLGKPTALLQASGFPDLPIELKASKLTEKSSNQRHPFDVTKINNLPEALNNPLAVFAYGDKDKAQNVITKLESDGKPFLVGVYFNYEKQDILINDIRGLFPKDNAEWLNWVSQTDQFGESRLLYINKKSVQTLIDQQRTNLAEVAYLDLNTVESIIQNHENVNLDLFQDTRGAYNPDSRTIALLENADLTTFQHELAHHFLEVNTRVAAQLQEAESLSESEQQVLADVQATLQWLGIADLATWHAMDLDEKRQAHEQYARGFEAYLFEGKTPSPELRSVFARVRAWMVSVYRTLTALNVKLNDDIRAVFDRLVATDDQIQQAQQEQAMMQLFETADVAGMDEDEFRQYQQNAQQAEDEAQGTVAKMALADLKWLSGAKDRRLKALQAEAKEARAALREDVEKMLMAQPIYRAWLW